MRGTPSGCFVAVHALARRASCPEVFLGILLRTGCQFAEFGAGACMAQAAALPLWPVASQRVALVVHVLRVSQQQGLLESDVLHRVLQGMNMLRFLEPSAVECDDGRVASVNVGVIGGVVVDTLSEVLGEIPLLTLPSAVASTPTHTTISPLLPPPPHCTGGVPTPLAPIATL
jgi:hypothetical protein